MALEAYVVNEARSGRPAAIVEEVSSELKAITKQISTNGSVNLGGGEEACRGKKRRCPSQLRRRSLGDGWLMTTCLGHARHGTERAERPMHVRHNYIRRSPESL